MQRSFYITKQSQLVYHLSIDKEGRLQVSCVNNFYSSNPFANGIDLEVLNNPNYSLTFDTEAKEAIGFTFLNTMYYKQFVTTHKTDKKVDSSLAENELVSYIENMSSIFKDEDVESWFEEQGLLAQWVKGEYASQINILLSETLDFNQNRKMLSYDELAEILIISSKNFYETLSSVANEWQKIKNGEYDQTSSEPFRKR